MEIQSVKQRFGIIGNTPMLNRALEIGVQVAPTDISVLVTGESGTGKEIIPQIIHQLSSRKHGPYIAVNCGAIPEGTIDSELFGHEKGSFTGAAGSRKGYFEVADGGTIFLDEVAELPLQTQVRLLRVLETGEFIKVGSSKVIKTNVRVVAATNEQMQVAIKNGKFREDLFYRLSTVPIQLPPLRDRKEDIHLLFRKFASDFAEKYRMPAIKLDPEAVKALINYNWPGNIRQLKNITEHISIVEQNRILDTHTLLSYLPPLQNNLPQVVNKETGNDFSEREILYKVLFDMKNDLNDLKSLVKDLMNNGVGEIELTDKRSNLINKIYAEGGNESKLLPNPSENPTYIHPQTHVYTDSPIDNMDDHIEVEESLSLEDREKELIEKALEKHKGKRKYAAQELGISERTLYRKIKEYKLK
jgi:transcriptional regulator with PAS, ATPase and Fis domain